MKTLGLILILLSSPLLAKETTCDLAAENAVLTVNENVTPSELITEFPIDGGGNLTFTEEITGIRPTQVTIMQNGQPVFIDALLYTTDFGSEVTLYELNGSTLGVYRGLFSGPGLELTNCTVQ